MTVFKQGLVQKRGQSHKGCRFLTEFMKKPCYSQKFMLYLSHRNGVPKSIPFGTPFNMYPEKWIPAKGEKPLRPYYMDSAVFFRKRNALHLHLHNIPLQSFHDSFFQAGDIALGNAHHVCHLFLRAGFFAR